MLRDKQLGSRLVIFKRILFFFVMVVCLSGQSSAMECQDQIFLTANWTSSEMVQYNTNVTSHDNVTYEPMDNSTFPVGRHNITATLNGSTDCTFILIVLANPVCPTTVSQPSDGNLTTTSVIWSYPAENRIDLFPLTSNPVNETTFTLGVTDVIVSLTDFSAYTCTFQVEVKDEQPPQLTCPESLDVNNSAVATWKVPMASDNSGNVLLSSTHRPGSYFPFNVSTEIIYTAVDSSGNNATCSFNLTVVRDGAPEITNCPSNLKKMIPPGVTNTTVTELWLQEPTATSPTGSDVTVSSDYNRNSIFGVGTTIVTYKFSDATGANSKCRFFVSITKSPDEDAPVVENDVECSSDIVQGAPPGTTEMTVTWVEPTFNDLVDGKDISITQTKESGNVFGAGTTQVLYVATDKSYNILQCIISVTVNVTEDNEAPVIVGCPNNITRWVGPTVTNVTITWTPPNATDNFQVATFTSSHESGSEFPAGAQTKVNYTATDLVGTLAICAFYVTINVDSERPVIMNCPSDINEFVAETVSILEVIWEPPTITDNSGMFRVDYSHQSGAMFPAGSVTQVLIKAKDEAGNVAVQCTFTVTVTVDPAPILICPSSSMILNDTVQGQAYALVWWLGEISVTDNTIFMSNSTEVNPLQVELNSPITVTYTVEDKRRNVRSCTFQVVANDTEPPVWTPCPSDITTPAVPGTNSATVSWVAPSVSDNSDETPLQITTPRSSQLFSGGTYTIIYRAEDNAGNMGTCQFFVTVTVDSAIPTINCSLSGPLMFNTPTGRSSANVTWNTITATDTTDGNVPVTSNFNPGDELSIGVYDVIYRAADSSGNVAMCQFRIEVTDPEPPVIISCPDDIITYALAQRVQTPVTWTTQATASDNSGSVILTSIPSSGSLFNTGQTTTVVYSAEDPSGNPSINMCSFTVTVQTTDLISIRGVVTLDSIRGNGIFLDQQTARESLEIDMAELLRGTSLAPVDFVDVLVPNSVTDSDGNLRASFTLFFSPDSHYNEEEINDIFYNALGNRVSFDSGNVIIADSFDLTVREYNGEFTLRSIVPAIDAVDFTSCCSDPSSESYQALLQKIYSYFDASFGSMHLFRMSRILPLRQGSVVVPYTLTFDGASTVTLNDIEQAFNATVQEPSRELSQTDLFLTTNGGIGDTVEVCPAGYCSNGGTCDVTNSDTYAFECSCQSGFSGTQCENTTSQLSTAEIIGIFIGVMGLVLILLVVCCCCLWLMSATSRRFDGDEENLVSKAPPPMLLLPMDEEYFRRPPRRQQRPIITEMPPEEPEPRPYRPPSPPPPSGPSFLHEDPLFVPPPQPQRPPQPMIHPPPPQHRRRQRSPPRQRKERPPSYYETTIAPQPPQLSRQILILPPPAPRWRRMRDRIDRYLPMRGPRFRGNHRPEPIVSINEIPADYNDGGPIRRYGSAPNYRGDYGPQLLPPGYHAGGGPIRRNDSRRSDAPRFRGNDVPEQVGDMKRRLFYEFNY